MKKLIKKIRFAIFKNEEIEKQKNYVANHCCPNCHGENVEVNVSIETNGFVATGFAGCSDCESTWQDQYSLVGFHSLEIPPQSILYFVAIYNGQHQRITSYDERSGRARALEMLGGISDFYQVFPQI